MQTRVRSSTTSTDRPVAATVKSQKHNWKLWPIHYSWYFQSIPGAFYCESYFESSKDVGQMDPAYIDRWLKASTRTNCFAIAQNVQIKKKQYANIVAGDDLWVHDIKPVRININKICRFFLEDRMLVFDF